MSVRSIGGARTTTATLTGETIGGQRATWLPIQGSEKSDSIFKVNEFPDNVGSLLIENTK